MRIYAISDIHVDYEQNLRWIEGLSRSDYRDDTLLLAGDVTDNLALLQRSLRSLTRTFGRVGFVPGNHDLWVIRDQPAKSSLAKFDEVARVARDCGVELRSFQAGSRTVVPLLGWYDYSFGAPGRELEAMWMDYRACSWPEGFTPDDVSRHFGALNESATPPGAEVVTFSHFLPRVDLMPYFIPPDKRFLYPVLGSTRIDAQLRALGSRLHVYGHSHVNRDVTVENVRYVNNAFGYPQESGIVARRLVQIHAE